MIVNQDKNEREGILSRWAKTALVSRGFACDTSPLLAAVSDDASFRRYYRAQAGDSSFIFVDAPPELEDSAPFVRVAELLRAAGLNAPRVMASDPGLGFMMLTDFGDQSYFDAVGTAPDRVSELYDDAIGALHQIQRIRTDLPLYDESTLRREMALFTEWFLPRQLEMQLSATETTMLAGVMDLMVANAVEQPQVFVHRDYHCRNLMIVEAGNPGIIDFQDAVIGPVTYDLVSLLRDCYFRFEPEEVSRRVEEFRCLSGVEVDAQTFRRWFDLMGIQRHIKVAGIFSRLNLRDHKPRYLKDIPRVVDYLLEAARSYEDLSAFVEFLDQRIVPRMPELA